MQNITLTVALIVSFLVLIPRSVTALAIFIALLMFYPAYLVLNIGTIDIPAMRIVITVLLLKCMANHNLRLSFKWNQMDTWVTLFIIVSILIKAITSPITEALENRAGFLINTWFVYIVTRLCLTNRGKVTTLAKWISIIFVLAAILGIIESYTGWQPYGITRQYCPWRPEPVLLTTRYGNFRAIGSFGQPIMFGSAFILFLPIVYNLRHEHGFWRILAYPLSIMVFIGALSSMSSGPWVAAIFAVFCLAMEHFKKWLKLVLIGFVFGCIFIEIASNRPFYHVLASYSNPIGGAAGHRAVIIDCAIEDFGKWWLVGYRGQDPGWGPRLGMSHTDVTNEFILAGVRYGLLGVIVLCGILVTAIRKMVHLHKFSDDPRLRSLAWALGSTLATVILTFMSVGLFAQTVPLFYCLLGIIGSSSSWVGQLGLPAKVEGFYRHKRIPALLPDMIAEQG